MNNRKSIRKNSVIISLILGTLLVVMAPACNLVNSTISQTNTKADQPIIGESSSSMIIHASFPELTYNSDIIVIARPVSAIDIVNTSRDVIDDSKPDPNQFSINYIYEIKIEKYLVGDGPETILLAQNQGRITQTKGKTPSPQEIRQVSSSGRESKNPPLRLGNRYLMFLRNPDAVDYVFDGYQSSYKAGELYSLLLPPRVFNLTDPDCVYPELPIQGYLSSFPPMPLTQIQDEMMKPFNPEDPAASIPYPPPEMSEDCLYLLVTPVPYPLPNIPLPNIPPQ
jgi:hypothetical protein